MEIFKLFNGTTEADMKNTSAFIGVPWDALTPAIKEIIRLRDDEVIDGFSASDAGLKVKLSRKRIYTKKSKTGSE